MGKVRVLISKPSICGMGLNLQHCRNVAFVGLSYSFEDFYQALRRSYRFGQTREVNAYIIQAQTEGAILRAIETKIQQHKTMQESMKQAAHELRFASDEKIAAKIDITTTKGDGWTVHHGDCVRVAKTIPDASVGFSVFSPPFADLFTYSSDPQDMGNCGGMAEFMVHFDHLIMEMFARKQLDCVPPTQTVDNTTIDPAHAPRKRVPSFYLPDTETPWMILRLSSGRWHVATYELFRTRKDARIRAKQIANSLFAPTKVTRPIIPTR